MPAITLSIPLPAALHEIVRKLRKPSRGNRTLRDLSGDRDIEWAWIASQIPKGPGVSLDFGPGGSHLALVAAGRGYHVTAIDLEPIRWPYEHEDLTFIRGDILEVPLADASFDLILNCSTVEHVGLVGRYGVDTPLEDGDLAAMERLRQLMKPGGRMLLTIPVGCDSVFPPLHRVYGEERLPRLIEGYDMVLEEYWLKDPANRWVRVQRGEALATEPEERLYGLGCFVLGRA